MCQKGGGSVATSAARGSGSRGVAKKVVSTIKPKRLGHMGKTAMSRKWKEELVRGLEGVVAGELGVCRGCELSKALAKPHSP